MDKLLTILQGDSVEMLATLPNESVQCCVTSPPYWGLRDYGTATWEGGDESCDHRRFNAYGSGLDGGKEAQNNGKLFKSTCGKCGAVRVDAQIGLEKSPQEYVAKMVEVFREVRRVLRDDGTLWLNLGDSYINHPSSAVNRNGLSGSLNNGVADFPCRDGTRGDQKRVGIPAGLKVKDLAGIPWRVAFALQEDGWWLRSDIIWHKPNPMPESVTDRPTKAHEYLFLLSKSERYFYDADAIAEPVTCERLRGSGPMVNAGPGRNDTSTVGDYRTNGKWSKEDPQSSGRRIVERVKEARANGADHDSPFGYTRNKRSVWTVATQSYPEAHFATYPPALIKPCILAGCPVGGVVLDPFAGSGTTGMVALELGRKAVLIELNPDYVALIHQRTSTTLGLGI